MKRIRLSTLMLLIIIAALAVALIVGRQNSGRASRALIVERQRSANIRAFLTTPSTP